MKEDNQKKPTSIFNQEQGVLMDCIYCKDLYPNRKENCPRCKGNRSYFQPAQMMDTNSSQNHILQTMSNFFEIFKSEKDQTQALTLKKKAIHLLEKIKIYNFDLKSALIDLIYELDAEFELEK
jgi:hypothetical protein